MTTTTATDWIGRVIDGRYDIETVLGQGGMGVVLAARHKFTRARVAVKMVRNDLGLDAELEARFLAEARVPTAIDHRGVVKTLDAGKTAEGELYIVMELLNGRSLGAQMASGLGGPSTRRIGMELLDVLAAAHARGIIHRDVKPENVFLVEPDLAVKLLDFGITKLLAGTTSVLPRTAAGAMLGTLAYMAPEQLVDASSVDARADLWSVGVILYEMLSGRRPYRATTVEDMLVALLKSEPDPIRIALPSAMPDVEAFFAHALAREPRRRFSSAAEMAMAFAQLPLSAPPPPIAKPSGGDVTLPTGFRATAAGPDRGAPVLTPFAGTRAVVIAAPAYADPPHPARPGGPAAVNRTFAIPPTPSRDTLPPPTPSRGTFPPPAAVTATAPTRAHRRFPWVLGGVSTLALGAAIVIAAGGSRQPTSSPRPHADVASPGPAPDPAPSLTPTPPEPAAPPEPTAPANPAPPVSPAPPPKRSDSPLPSIPPPPRAGRSQPKDRAIDPHPRAAPLPPHPRDATTPPNPVKPAAATPPEAPRPAEMCAAGCKMLASCHLGSRTCEADCAHKGTLNSCLQQAAGDCNRFAACWFAASCHGVAPRGQHSCSAAMDCETACNASTTCICSCVRDLSISHAAALLGYNGCALGCRDADCVARRCGSQARACRAE